MAIFRIFRQLNWKYIIGEIILLFIGINLAIWFNDWNASRNAQRDKQYAVVKLKEEISSNLEDLKKSHQNNQKILEAYAAFSKIYEKTTSQVIASPSQLKVLQTQYPEYFTTIDSTALGEGRYFYDGRTSILLELPDLREIAWMTIQGTRVANELSYECLYDLESMYNLQQRILRETDKAAEALQKRDVKGVMHTLEFTKQLVPVLEQAYQDFLEQIDNC